MAGASLSRISCFAFSTCSLHAPQGFWCQVSYHAHAQLRLKFDGQCTGGCADYAWSLCNYASQICLDITSQLLAIDSRELYRIFQTFQLHGSFFRNSRLLHKGQPHAVAVSEKQHA